MGSPLVSFVCGRGHPEGQRHPELGCDGRQVRGERCRSGSRVAVGRRRELKPAREAEGGEAVPEVRVIRMMAERFECRGERGALTSVAAGEPGQHEVDIGLNEGGMSGRL